MDRLSRDSSSSGGGGSSSSQTVAPSLGGGSYSSPGSSGQSDAFDDVGKTSIDLTKLGSSIAGAAGSLGQFGAGLVGGVAGAIGQVGFGDGKNLGAVADVPGNVIGAAGSIPLPYLGNDPTRTNAHLGDVPGMALNMLAAPGKAVERGYAGVRVRASQGEYGGLLTSDLPRDLANALDAGEITVEQAADELVARGAGFSNNAILNLAGEVVLDPMNFILPGASKAAQGAKAAGLSLEAGAKMAELGLPKAFAGTLYNAATRNMSGVGSAAMNRVIGPATAGVFHSLGTKPFGEITSGLARVSDAYVAPFQEALARGSAQFAPAIVARQIADDVKVAFKEAGVDALGRFKKGQELTDEILARVGARKKMDAAALEREVEHMADRTVPQFRGVPAEQVADETTRKLAQITGASAEDALRALGGKVTKQAARMVHLAFYGKAGGDLALAKVAAQGAKNIDVERLTIIAPDTLTDVRAKEIIDLMAKGDAPAVDALIDRYEILNRKLPKGASHADVKKYIKNLQDNDALPHQVKPATTGKNALPSALGDWRKTYNEFGYDLGFGPKDGWKAIVEPDGNTTISDPFIHFTSEMDPLTQRNALGKVVDSVFRGVTQTKIIGTARTRFLDEMNKYGVLDSDAERAFGAILSETKKLDRQVTPRGLEHYDDLFKSALGDEAFAALRKQQDPTYIVMKAFEGNWREIGLTQKLTGKIKTAGAKYGNIPAGVAEAIYPKMRYKYRPIFQMQELIESPFWNALRGIRPTPEISGDVGKVMLGLADEGPEYRYMFEAGYTTHMATGQVVDKIVGQDSLIGKALGKVAGSSDIKSVASGGVKGVKERARIAQVFSEHGAYFENAVNKVSPRLWKTMTEAYGTTDAREIAGRFIQERFALAENANPMAAFRGATATADEATVMAAFEEGLRQSMKQAFKTHYFSSERSFLERTINHPYLGLYPASYMWGKVAPEFARFLLRRPFGLDAPLVGLNAYNRVQQAVAAEQLNNEDFANFLKENPDVIYLINILLPGTPENLPVNAPGYARHLSRDIQEGKKINPQRYIETESADMISHASVAGDAGTFASAGADIFDSLTKAAAMFDGMFGKGTTPPPATGGESPFAPPPNSPIR